MCHLLFYPIVDDSTYGVHFDLAIKFSMSLFDYIKQRERYINDEYKNPIKTNLMPPI